MGSLIRTKSGDTIHVALEAQFVVARLRHAGEDPVEFTTPSGDTVTVFGLGVVETVRPCSNVLVPRGTVPAPSTDRRMIDTTKTKGKKA